MFISELAKQTGLTVHTIRFYEEEEAYDAGSLTKEQQVVSLRRKVETIGKQIAELELLQTTLLSKLAVMERKEMVPARQDDNAD